MMSVGEALEQASKLLEELPQGLAECRTQDEYHRVEVGVQYAQALCLYASARKQGLA
jgi:hypothetical protein